MKNMLHIITFSANAHIVVIYVAESLLVVMLYECRECVVCALSIAKETLSGKLLSLQCMVAIADEPPLNPHIEYF